MFNNKILSVSLMILGGVLLTTAILLAIYSYTEKIKNNENLLDIGSQNMYLLITKDKKYGIAKVDGSVVKNPQYTSIARINNTAYLSTDSESYIFSLKDGTSVSFGKKESALVFAYSKENILLPYYVFRYGSESNSIYRVYREDGTRYGEKDYTSKKEVMEYLNAKQLVDVTTLPETLKASYKLISVINYKTKNEKVQYIVSRIEDKDKKPKQGIVDEDGNIVLSIEYDSIVLVDKSRNSVRAEKSEKAYLFTRAEKLIEIESGYDAIMYEQGYYIQKRGSIVNKVFNVNSELVREGIFNYPGDLFFISTVPDKSKSEVVPYLLIKNNNTQYDIHNLLSNTVNKVTLNNFITEYMQDYTQEVIVTALLYKNNNAWYAYSLSELKSYKITVKNTIICPLDMGMLYQAK